VGIAAGVVAALPLVLRDFHVTLLTEATILGLLAVSLDLVMGYTGLVSFGHAAFFGIGAYTAALLLLHTTTPLAAVLGAALAVNAVLGAAIGFLAIRARGIYFAMLTLALSEILYRVVWDWRSVTGGSDGLPGVGMPPLTFAGLTIPLASPRALFYFVALVAAAGYALCRGIVASRFGRVLEAIRENEQRCEFIGFDVRTYKLATFAVSAALAGLCGALYAPFAGFASPELLAFSMSGKVIVMALVGGLGTLIGPFVGGAFLTVLESFVSQWVKDYILVIGLTFVAVVLFFPAGLVGTARRWRRAG
jgi:branched-chain amino acid transport system permease protein